MAKKSAPTKLKKSPKQGKVTERQSTASSSDLWLNVFLSIFGISLFFSGIQSLGFNDGPASILGVIAALSGGVVLGLSLGKFRNRSQK